MLLPADFRHQAADKTTLFASFLALFYGHPVCNSGAYGETIHEYCGAVRRPPGQRTDLRGNSIFAAPEGKAPPHDCARGGAVARPRFPDALRRRPKRGGGDNGSFDSCGSKSKAPPHDRPRGTGWRPRCRLAPTSETFSVSRKKGGSH